MNPVKRFRIKLLLAASVVIAAVLWLRWHAVRNPDVSFLQRHAPAEWIVYPNPPDANGILVAELDGVFRRSFVVRRVPAGATLSVRAFKHGVVTLNDTPLAWATNTSANWKQAVTWEVARLLRTGTNEVTVTVFNDKGPPALWLALNGDGVSLVSDASWEVSYAGAVWRMARLARQPMAAGKGSSLIGGVRVMAAVWNCWPRLLLWTTLLAGVVWWWERRVAQSGPVESSRQVNVAAAGVVLLWVVLFTHNLGLLPAVVGFDVNTHLDYVSYILQRHALPLAHEGPSMYNPPLYYLLCALVLKTLSLSTTDFAGIIALRVLNLLAGAANLVLVAASVRLLFPNQTRKHLVGLVLAAFLPMHVYISHYVTNEPLVSVWVTAAIYVCLLAVRDAKPLPTRHAWVGLCLGAALLTKPTAVVLAPFVMAALMWRLWAMGRRDIWAWCRTVGLMLVVCLAVCGWHYLRVWLHFGKPLVGAWDPASGHAWWQFEGYRTSAYFLRFGASLVSPLFSALNGFGDGVYSTLWGDGLCGGVTGIEFRPPWNYDSMAVGYVLALLPAAAMLVGAGLTVWQFLRAPSPEWLVVNGLAFSFLLAFIYLALVVPCYSEIKAFYGLMTLLPLVSFGAVGWDWLAARGRVVRRALIVLLAVWALNSYSTSWIPGQAAFTQVRVGMNLEWQGRLPEAAERYAAVLRQEPHHLEARSLLGAVLADLGRTNEARLMAEQALKDHPDEAICHMDVASALEADGQLDLAIEQSRRATALAPDSPVAWRNLTIRLSHAGRHAEVIAACREGLRVTPASGDLHFLLGASLAELGKQNNDVPASEIRRHFRAALQLRPNTLTILNNAAWILATYPRRELRDGAEAAKLAEGACQLTGYQRAATLNTLAAAYAEAGRFADAITAAQRAQVVAQQQNQNESLVLSQTMLKRFQAGQPYHETQEGQK